MNRILISILIIFSNAEVSAQEVFQMQGDVRIAIDHDAQRKVDRKNIVVLYALPNGNSIEQTMGKKPAAGDDWHFDIQHIRAQTVFIREKWKEVNFTVVYLENTYRSWPAWKAKHADFRKRVRQVVDTLLHIIPGENKQVFLNGHSGGGRFIFSFIDAYPEIPAYIKRISFLDSNYGYDSSYTDKLMNWLKRSAENYLNVFAYNDSVALYEGKPVVSPTGGTWYRSKMMHADMAQSFSFKKIRADSVLAYKSTNNRIHFFFKLNPDRRIFHTQQVELNGFIHSIFCGTKRESRGYRYYDRRAYESLMR